MPPKSEDGARKAGRWEVIKVECLDCGKEFEVRGQAIADLREHTGPDGALRLRIQP